MTAMGLCDDELKMALAATDAWVARLVCRAFRDRCERRDATLVDAVQSVARLKLALELGADRLYVGRAAARAGKLEVLQWARDHGCKWGPCVDVQRGGARRASEGSAVGALHRVRVGHSDVPRGAARWSPRGARLGARPTGARPSTAATRTAASFRTRVNL